MRLTPFLLTLFLFFCTLLNAQQTQVLTPLASAPHVPAQVPPPILTRDAQALTIAQASLNALGGMAAIAQAQSWQMQASVQGANEMAKRKRDCRGR